MMPNPSYRKIHHLSKSGRYLEALACAEDCIIDAPDDVQLWVDAGKICRILSDYDKAEFYLRKAFSLNPDFALVVNQLALLLADTGKSQPKNFEEAILLLKAFNRPIPSTFHTMSIVLETMGDIKAAEQVLIHSCEHYAYDIKTVISLGYFHLRQHDFLSFDALITKVGKVEMPSFIKLRATSAFMQGEVTDAQDLCLTYLKRRYHGDSEIAALYLAITANAELDEYRLMIKDESGCKKFDHLLHRSEKKYGKGGEYAPVKAKGAGYQAIAPNPRGRMPIEAPYNPKT